MRPKIIILKLFLCIIFGFEDASNQNLALRNPTANSSAYSTSGFMSDSNLMVDGDPNPNYLMKHCFHCDDGAGGPNWAVVDLLSSYYVDYVYLFQRDRNSERLDYFLIGLTSVNYLSYGSVITRGSYPLCGQYKYKAVISAKLTLNCNANLMLPYRYVIAQQPVSGPGMFTICEMEVYSSTNLNFKIWTRYFDYRLLGYTSEITNVSCIMRCLLKCTVGKCDSINFQWNSTICELNKHFNGYALTSLNASVGWNFYEVQFA